ncbi:putative 4-amino-4-deoxy-L-arabinose transferase [Gluconacetobacter sp. SXCC-1]|uniref:Glycosyltransferase family 39 protein n=1 Tax=Komagataeibacter rhaeticus TaxID=215221 RepID=A0A858JLW0_9PROT|nr:glycosyltransferase family 39 protein [Komagataeibacter rhaeticus]ATU72362.1 4-amino-4-deoxy-L-arabinose transferase [Komagataeibacter xylinus]EGG74973.1 putative 4-amino-4-deoxy-L-arabinose transferase [Gluconacetobacter sp. SXCC-1]QIP35719.1 glycosyltransferase family 39 protein [Komagataeibacter rhaeticus]QOC45478.1 glycosyltransferase family 39 protein [Komagataeibacter rhaeticus]WPP22095.1 glycosyltransferase family 39 protein [Komagataeibacter rhaeticus]
MSAGYSPSRWLYPLGLLACVRLVVAGWLPLSPDEAYYRVWALAPAASYLDHPPMVAVWLRLGLLLAGDSPLGARLVGVLAGCGLSFFIIRAARDLVPDGGRERGWRAALLLQATLALAIQSVVITPDMPVLFFVAMLLWCMGRIVAGAGTWWWGLAGLAAGLAFDSKYTAILPVAGIGLWLGLQALWGRWAWVRGQAAGVAGALGLVALVVAPVVWWNARHDWASFARQGGRTADWHPARAFQYLTELLGGQLGLMTPGVALFFAGGMTCLLRRARRHDPGAMLLACMTCVPACVFVQHALGDRVQANWPLVIYPLLAVGTAVLGWRWGRWAVGGGMAMGAMVYAQALFALLPLSAHTDVALRQMAGWRDLAARINDVARPGEFIAACDYGTAAELASVMPGRVVVGMEPRWALFSLPHGVAGDGVMVCNPRREFERADFTLVQPLGVVMRGRHGRVAEPVGLYRVHMREDLPAARVQSIARLPVPPQS